MSDVSKNDPHPQVVEGMMAFTIAGFPVFPLARNKRPGVPEWGPLRTTPPDLTQVEAWGSQRFDGYAVICGAEQRLLMIDFEVGFMEQLVEMRARLDAAGLGDVFESWLQGYCVETPSGGMHVGVRVGDGVEMPGNQKWVMASQSEVLVETRAEGGYVVGPGSGGRCHPSGRPWIQRFGGPDTICYGTPEEVMGVQAVLRTFDTQTAALPNPTVPTRSTMGFEGILGDNGPGWINDVKANLPSMRQVLDAHGWVPSGRRDQFGAHQVRPGKNPREGHSASISDADRLWVYSSNAGLPTGVSLDVVDVLWCYATGRGDRQPSLDERTAWLEAQRPTPPGSGVGASPGGGPEAAALNLPPDFWESREYLDPHPPSRPLPTPLPRRRVGSSQMLLRRDASHGTIGSPATEPWTTYRSTSANPEQANHGPNTPPGCCSKTVAGLQRHRLPGPRRIRRRNDRPLPRQRQQGPAIQSFVASATTPTKANSSSTSAADPGNTTMQAIKQMWSGELTGSVAATADRHRWLEPTRRPRHPAHLHHPRHRRRIHGHRSLRRRTPPTPLMGLGALPTPRAPNPTGPDHSTSTSGTTTPPPTTSTKSTSHPDLATLIDQRLLAAAKGQRHRRTRRPRHLRHRKNSGHPRPPRRPTQHQPQDWALAQQDWETTRTVRHHVQTSHPNANMTATSPPDKPKPTKKSPKPTTYLEQALHSLIRKLKHAKTPLNNRQIKDHLPSFHKHHQIHHREVINLAISRGLVDNTVDGYHLT